MLKNIRIPFFFLVFFASSIVNAQQVISAAGSPTQIGINNSSWTLGEVAVKLNPQFSEGFQQGDVLLVFLKEKEVEVSIEIFPVPVKSTLTIKSTQTLKGYEAVIVDNDGRTVVKKRLNSNYNEIEVTQLSSSYYYLQFINSKGIVKTVPFIKID